MDMNSSVSNDWEIDQSLAIGPQIFRILRQRIVYNDIKPGTSISEPAIAKIYNISRQPVREAFIKLSDVGLVEIRPQRGTFVRKISYEEVMEARFVREAIEADIVQLLARERDTSLVKELRHLLVLQENATGSPFEFILCDEQFHRTLAEAAGKRQTWRFIDDLKTQMDRVRILRLQQYPIEKLIQQHTAVVDAIEQGDSLDAVVAIRTHMRELLQVLPEIFQAHPDLFEGPALSGLNIGSSHMEENDEDAV
ncbi:transcriptional regulator, GntR family [Cohaesibacter sp. ES.047]|uniref:GntR family transcriptional regulator n=1 Tax=Cohaesibacter sp. ES.047 TaxID=1798205 RepID=UPI000BB6BEBE|nr:GntR family transcriptional regulator [Cohaesibacter sp. ES.047]SNY92236.1 transcriptional regulator, GntR family [Cohaesibacter sp. ES.047]